MPGDIVAIEAGDIVPADGRLTKAATLEVDESALTGESLPVAKGTEPVAGADTALGDRTDMVYMNTNVSRGAGEFVVTATGMATEVGHISGLLAGEQLPFDAAYKLMATFHKMTDASGQQVIRCFVKGAPDQLVARAATVVGTDDGPARLMAHSGSGTWPRISGWESRACG